MGTRSRSRGRLLASRVGGLLPIVALIAALAGVIVYTLERRAASNVRTAALLQDIAVDAHGQSSLAWQTLAAGNVGPTEMVKMDTLRDRIDGNVAELRSAGFDSGALRRLQRARSAYHRGLDELVLMIRNDAVSRAKQVQQRRVVPNLERLERDVAELSADATATARDEERTAGLGSLLTLGVAALLILAVGSRSQGVKRRQELAAAGERALRDSEKRFRSLVENATDMITVVDADGRIRLQTSAVRDMLARSGDSLTGTAFADLVHPDDQIELAQAESGTTVEWRMRHADGHWVHVETVVASLLDDPDIDGLVLTTRDASARKALEEQLRHRAFHDPLTQLPNRALFYDRVEHAVARKSRGGELLAVLFIDLDDFKLVNDRFGHAAGDHLLTALSRRVRGSMRSSDTTARLGGDEFGVLIEGIGGAGEAVQAAERLLAAFNEPLLLHGEPVRISPSVGIAISSLETTTVDDVLRMADVAMYRAKRNGKARYELYDPRWETDTRSITDADGERVTWFMRSQEQRAEIESVLAQPEKMIVPVFQPIVELSTGRVVGYEALARFPEGPRRPPNAWFAQAHRCGLGPQLEALALRRSLGAPDRPEGTYLSVNLSPSALASAYVQAALPDDLGHIVIEITENELVAESQRLLETTAELQSRGVRIAVDDAGAGYASLKQLMHLRPDLIKLDRGLIANVDDDPAKMALIDSFVRFARRTEAIVCAEGIETLEELRMLADLDVTLGQGYGLARPAKPWAEVVGPAAAVCAEQLDRALTVPAGPEEERLDDDRAWEHLSSRLADAGSLEETAGLAGLMSDLLDADSVVFSRLEDNAMGSWLVLVWDGGIPTADDRWNLADYPDTRHVLDTGEAMQVLASDPAADPGELEILHANGFRSLLMVPVISRGEPVGLLEVYSGAERPWTRRQINRARIACHQLGPVLASLPEGRLAPAPRQAA